MAPQNTVFVYQYLNVFESIFLFRRLGVGHMDTRSFCLSSFIDSVSRINQLTM